MKRWMLLCISLSFTSSLYSQTSAYQDSDGNTSIYLRDPKVNFTFNVSDTKFTVGYLSEVNKVRRDKLVDKLAAETDSAKQAILQSKIDHLNDKLENSKFGRSELGIHFFGKPTTDLTGQILQNSNSPASVGGGMYYGIHRLAAKDLDVQAQDLKNNHPDKLVDDWLTVNVTYSKSTFNTVATGDTSLTAQHFNGFSVMTSYNALVNVPFFSFLPGVSAGVSRTNNSGDLKKVEVATTVSSSGTTSVITQKDAYMGDYKESVGAPIYADFVFVPKGLNWISFDAFERANVASAVRYAEGGIGVFISKPDKPTDVLGGISVGWKDGKSTVAVVAGWTF